MVRTRGGWTPGTTVAVALVGALAMLGALALPAASGATEYEEPPTAFEPALEAQNFAITQERQAVYDTPERTARSFQIINELTREHGLVTSEMVPAMRAMDDHGATGLTLARHDF